MLDHAQLLFEKGLYSQTANLLKKCRKMAEQSHDTHQLLLIVRRERQLITRHWTKEKKETALLGNSEELLHITNTLQLEARLIKLHSQLHLQMVYYGKINSNAQQQQIQNFSNSDALQEAKSSTDPQILLWRHNILNQYEWLVNKDIAKSQKQLKAMIDLFDQNPGFAENQQRNYLSSLHNYMLRSAYMEKFEEVKEGLERLNAIVPKNQDNASTRFESYHIFTFQLMMQTANFEGFDELSTIFQNGLVQFKDKINRAYEMYLYSTLSVVHFMRNEFDDALIWINKYINTGEGHYYSINLPVAEIYRLLIFYEMEQIETFEYQLRNAKSVMKRYNHFPVFCKKMLSALGKISGLKDRQEHKAFFNNLGDELVTIKQLPEEEPAFGLFDFIRWAKGKALGDSLVSVVRAELKQSKDPSLK